ncbi:MAG: tRNA lysidine(34) synthetase TilS [Alphaproteobacteria bacterium]
MGSQDGGSEELNAPEAGHAEEDTPVPEPADAASARSPSPVRDLNPDPETSRRARTGSRKTAVRIESSEGSEGCECCDGVSVDEFSRWAEQVGLVPPIALAVSGGGDSMALLRLVQRWAATQQTDMQPDPMERSENEAPPSDRPPFRRRPGRSRTSDLPAWLGGTPSGPPPVTLVTVDHGLRAESADEAAWVAKQAQALGLPHVTLRAEQDSRPDRSVSAGSANLQAQARAARYRLLEAWCRENGVPTLLTGHTEDDQAETVLMRLIRGSGVDGLAGIPERTVLRDPGGRASTEVLRPFLGVSRCRLRRTLVAFEQPWLEDASNEDERFTRVRIRRLLEGFAAEGLTTARLAGTARRMARARAALEETNRIKMADAVTWHRAGFAWVGVDDLLRGPEEFGLRVLSHVIQGVGGLSYPPRHDRLLSLFGALKEHRLDRVRTLGNCRIAPVVEGGVLMVVRENRNQPRPLPLPAGAFRIWDGRFQVSLPKGALSGEVRPLGAGIAQVFPERRRAPKLSLPQSVRLMLPALWCGTTVLCVPHLGYDPERSGFCAIFQNDDVNLPCHLDASYGHSA